MGRGSREGDFDAFVGARSAALLRTAYLVSGEAAAAESLLVGALATTYLGWRRIDGPESVEVVARRELLTAAYARDQPDAARVGTAESGGQSPDSADDAQENLDGHEAAR